MKLIVEELNSNDTDNPSVIVIPYNPKAELHIDQHDDCTRNDNVNLIIDGEKEPKNFYGIIPALIYYYNTYIATTEEEQVV